MRRPHRTDAGPGVRGGWAAVREPVLDGSLAILLWVGMAVDLSTRPLVPGQTPSTALAYLLAALVAAPVAFHRRWPIGAMAVSTMALVVYSAGQFSAFPGYTSFALVFAVALHAGRRTAFVVYLGGLAGLALSLALQPPDVATASSWISTFLTVTVAWLAGENLRSRRRRRSDELAHARREAEQEAERARRAVSAERLRIARDLHDVVAHSMSVIAVQAGVAHHVIDDRPDVARDALGSIEVTAREGLVEMRRLLGLLRSESDATDAADRHGAGPVEGLRDVDRLLSQVRAAGLQVETCGEAGDLPAAVDISAYRIVQEGLTNVLRHGGPVAHLSITRTPTEVHLQIRDEGRDGHRWPAHADTGHGLTGIRERAALFGGTVHAGPQPGGGFLLDVVLPAGPSGASR